jgi:hypothetical protein
LDPALQQAVAVFLLDEDEFVRMGAYRFLSDDRESPLAENNQLRADTLGKILEYLQDPSTLTGSRILLIRALGKHYNATFFQDRLNFAAHDVLKTILAALDPRHPKAERLEAARALEKMKPAESWAQLNIVRGAFEDPEVEVRNLLFTALGVRHSHQGDHRVGLQSAGNDPEGVKASIAAYLKKILEGKLRDPQGTSRQDGAEVLLRNPPRTPETFATLVELLAQWPRTVNADTVTAHKLRTSLIACRSFQYRDGCDKAAIYQRLIQVATKPEVYADAREAALLGKSLLDMDATQLGLFAAEYSSDGAARLELARDLSKYSKDRWKLFLEESGSDVAIARILSDEREEVRFFAMTALYNHDLCLTKHPQSLNALFNLANEVAPATADNSVKRARSYWDRLLRTRNRLRWISAEESFTPLIHSLNAISANEASPMRRQAESTLTGLRNRRDMEGSCLAELLAQAEGQG